MKKPRSRPLTAKQRRFVAASLSGLNAKDAAIRAGYSPAHARQIGYALLRRCPPVSDAVAAAMEERAKRTLITPERVLRELARVAFADIRRFTGPDGVKLKSSADLSDDDAAAVAELCGAGPNGEPPTLRLHDKRGALAAIAGHLGLVGPRRKHPPEPERDTYGPQIPAREILRRKLEELAAREKAEEGSVAPPAAVS